MVEIVQNPGGYVFGRKRAESTPAPMPKEEHTPKPEVVVPKEKKLRKKAEPKEDKPKEAKPKAEKKKKEEEPKN